MKSQIRVLGVDDAPFAFKRGSVPVVGIVMRLPSYVEGVMVAECTIDGTDANDVIERMVVMSRFYEQIKLVMVDGVALGGFNVVDISRLGAATSIPFATVTRDPPDMAKIRSALMAHFPDWERRLEVIQSHRLIEIPTSHKPIHVSVHGMDFADASRLIRDCTLRGNIPEPIRIAHLVASAIARGESRGRP